MTIDEKFDKLNLRIFKLLREGKINFNEPTIELLTWHLNKAVKLEDYESAEYFKNYITKLNENQTNL